MKSNKGKSSPKAPVVAESQQAPAPKPSPTIQVKEGQKFGGARKAWYERLLSFQGKPLAEYEASCEAQRPSLPKSGRPEAVSGWVRYFTKTGVLTTVAPKA